MESDNRRYSKRESDRDRSHNRRDRPDGHREKRRTHRDKHHRGRRHRSRERRHHQDNANFEEYSGNLQGSKEPDSCKYDEPAANDYTHSNDSENHRKVFQEDNKTLSEILKADFAEFDSDEERYVSLEKKADSDDEQYMGGRKEEKTQDKSPDPFLENAKDQSEVEEESQIDESLRDYYPALEGCRSLDEFQCLNKIAEGTYGIVYRSMDKRTHDIVALKKLKMEKEREGFPITSLREINTLLKGQHENIVTVREIVFGSNNSMDKIFIVMDYIEHDLKSLMELMKKKEQRFTPGEIKCLLKQLLAAVAHLHDNWILHRDLKTSNLLLSHKGILKVGDFGLAREYGSPLKPYTPIVVTLWYRAPELLLGTRQYSTHVDMWSVGCIFAEFVLMNPIFPGKSEIEQINRIFKFLGTPSEKLWPGYNKLPLVQKAKLPHHQPASNLRKRFQMLSDVGLYFLLTFFKYDPSQRVSAEDALTHPFFNEYPAPIDPSMFPKWPAKSELGHKRAVALSPKPPSGGGEFKKLDDDGFRIGLEAENTRMGAGFSLKF